MNKSFLFNPSFLTLPFTLKFKKKLIPVGRTKFYKLKKRIKYLREMLHSSRKLMPVTPKRMCRRNYNKFFFIALIMKNLPFMKYDTIHYIPEVSK